MSKPPNPPRPAPALPQPNRPRAPVKPAVRNYQRGPTAKLGLMGSKPKPKP